MKDTNARIYRRHRPTCRFFGAENSWGMLNCSCPLYGDGYVDGKRVLRKSLDTRSQAVASKRLADLMARHLQQSNRAPAHADKSISDAAASFLAHYGAIQDGKYKGSIEFSTYRKYRGSLRKFDQFFEGTSVTLIREVDLASLDDYRAWRERFIATNVWLNELQLLIQFWSFCMKRGWVAENVPKAMERPRRLAENEIEPYSALEESRILSACDDFGRSAYERHRARAMIQLHRFTGLAISDVATLEKSRVQWDTVRRCWKILVRRQKTGKPVFLPIPDELKITLDALPLPRNGPADCLYFFWNGVTTRRAVIGIAERTMSAVFKKSGVKNAGTHRFRHTLATRLLARGAGFEEIADILGNTPEIVRNHYAKWSKGRQDRIDDLMLGYVGGLRESDASNESGGYNLGTETKRGCN